MNPPSAADGPPTATTDKSGYFPYVWCLAGTYTYVFIDPTGSYGYNNGSNEYVFQTGLQGAWNSTQQAMIQQGNLGKPLGETRINDDGMEVQIPIQNIPGFSTASQVQIFAHNANHQQLTYGSYAAGLTIIQDFITRYPLYADTMYFQISEGKYGTVGKGYMGLVEIDPDGTQECLLKPHVNCDMPSDYPDN